MPTADQPMRHFSNCSICEAGCGLVIETGADGTIKSIRGDPDDPVSKGYVCPKSQAMGGLGHDPDRIRRPLRKTADDFVEIGWDEAFALAAMRLGAIRNDHGADAIATYIGNPVAGNAGAVLFTGALTQAIGSRQVYTAASIDAYPRMLANALMFGDIGINPVPDVDRTDLLVILGANPAVTNGSMLTMPGLPRRLADLRQRGGRLFVVDPRRTRTAELADEHFAIQPSTDALLLLALVNTLFGENLAAAERLAGLARGLDTLEAICANFPAERVSPFVGIDADRIRGLARELAAAPRAAIYGRVGTCCQPFGSIASWLIECLNVLTGNMDREGGMLIPRPVISTTLFSSPFSGGEPPHDRFRTRVRGLPELGGRLPAAALAEEIASPGDNRVRALISLAGNPARSFPDSNEIEAALRDLDFMISIDFYLNETSRHADLILPPLDSLEEDNFTLVFGAFNPRSYARYAQAIGESGEGYHDWQILARLGAAIAGLPADRYEEDYVAGLVAWSMRRQRHDDLSPDSVLGLLQGRNPLQRLCDFFIRSGPFGDGFGERDGLTLDGLLAAPHGVDFGYAPTGALPQGLRTPDRLIDLAPAAIVADVERLEQWLAEDRFAAPEPAKGEFLLAGRRDLRSMNSWLHNLPNLAKGPSRERLHIHPGDAVMLDIHDGDLVAVEANGRRISIVAELNDDVVPGQLSLPHGWGHYEPETRMAVAHQRPGTNYNCLTNARFLDAPSGNAAFNGVRVLLSRCAASGT